MFRQRGTRDTKESIFEDNAEDKDALNKSFIWSNILQVITQLISLFPILGSVPGFACGAASDIMGIMAVKDMVDVDKFFA